MSIQLPLPAGWARAATTWRASQDHLDQIARDVLDAKVAIRQVIEALAKKHGISAREITGVTPMLLWEMADMVKVLEDWEEQRTT